MFTISKKSFCHYGVGISSFILNLLVVFLCTGVIVTDCAVSDSVIYNKKSTIDPEVPLVFPNDPNRYKIISNNSSLLERFLYHSINMSNPEIVDMLNIQELKDSPAMSEIDRILKDPVDNSKQKENKEDPVRSSNPKDDEELLQVSGADVEKDMIICHNKHLNIGAPSGFQKQTVGKWIAMSAAIVLTLAATIYISMLLWKKSLERRYGSRQIMLEDEEAPEEYKHSMV